MTHEAPQVILYRSDTLLEVLKVKNKATGVLIPAATVTVTLKDLRGQNVVGATWPITLAAVGGSAGDYQGILPDILQVQPGRRYVAKVTVDGGNDLHREWRVDCQVEESH